MLRQGSHDSSRTVFAANYAISLSRKSREVSSFLTIGCRGGKDCGDHPPITPMMAVSEYELQGGDSWRLYNLVTRHFLASLSPDSTFAVTKATFQIGKETFTATGKHTLSPGFTAVLTSYVSRMRTSIINA